MNSGMIESPQLNALLQAQLPAIQNELPGSHESWVRVMRKCALERFFKQGIPTTRNEAWKYTDVRKYTGRLGTLSAEKSASEISVEALSEFFFKDLECHRVVVVDGRVSSELSSLSTLPAGVRVESMAKMLAEEAHLLEPYMHDQHLSGAFSELNAAVMRDGIYIDIPDGIAVEKPLHLFFLSQGRGEDSSHIRNLIVAGEYSQATVIEHFGSLGGSRAFINVATDVELHRSARVEHYKLQQSDINEVNIGSVRVHQHRDSYYHSHSVAFGAALSRRDIHVELNGEGAECMLNGLYLVGGRQHVDHHTRIDHVRPDCKSRESYKGIIDGRARAVFNGKVVVHKGADRTDSAQSNANLLLSDKAEIDTKPDLEIHADDVKCAHGATVGQLDMNQLFYLRSRGLSVEEARNVLMFAFADEVLASIKVPEVRRYLERAAFEKLPYGAGLEEMLV